MWLCGRTCGRIEGLPRHRTPHSRPAPLCLCVYRPIVLIILSLQSESTWSPQAASSLFPTGFNGCSHESLEGKAELEVACGGSVAATWRRCAGSIQAGSNVRAGEHLATCLPAMPEKAGWGGFQWPNNRFDLGWICLGLLATVASTWVPGDKVAEHNMMMGKKDCTSKTLSSSFAKVHNVL